MEIAEIKGFGQIKLKKLWSGLSPASLTELALSRGEGKLTCTGALAVNTGRYTGRAAKDKYIVNTFSVHEDIAWGNINRPISREAADRIIARAFKWIEGREAFEFKGYAGANKAYSCSFRVIAQYASQCMFIHQLLRRFDTEPGSDFSADFTILAVPDFHCDPETDGTRGDAAVIIDFDNSFVLIAGTRYAGEIKKSVFSVMNYILPKKGVLPMHCSANIGESGDTAVFFGLSGTGKTTLSTDPERRLIGDDEHGWADEGVFNFEGGCYAKCAHLSRESEPDIYGAIRFGALLENTVMDDNTRMPDYEDLSITENTRVGYPIDYINNIQPSGMGSGAPKAILLLTADAFGVLPPVSRLTKEQAMYYFASGFTSKVAGTENGITEPVPTFSACFGEPFLPLSPAIYVKMLAERLDKHATPVYLINTGRNGTGKRIKLRYTRAMVHAAISGELDRCEFVKDKVFNLSVPSSCTCVPSELLNPADTWEDKTEYLAKAEQLAALFMENFKKYPDMPDEVREAGPKPVKTPAYCAQS